MEAITKAKQANKEITDDSKVEFEQDKTQDKKQESDINIITKEAKTLKNKEGIHEIILLNDEDRLQVFEKEEERNHGVHEVLRKSVVYAIIHGESFSVEDQNEVIRI